MTLFLTKPIRWAKWPLWLSLCFILLALCAMAQKTSYMIWSCFPSFFDGEWQYGYSYFDAAVYHGVTLGWVAVTLPVLVCDTAVVVCLSLCAWKKQIKKKLFLSRAVFSFLFCTLGTFYVSFSTGTARGSSNCYPFFSVIAAVLAALLILGTILWPSLAKWTYGVTVGCFFCTLFSLLRTPQPTLYTIAISALIFAAAGVQFIKLRKNKRAHPLDRIQETPCAE